ncbi:bifunctional 23S rRNA (guanine(2069)-N(7))-methyltransferase RlmK/23S rRNA (guanine(2445)-N(2))-methyltransferase RlmL [Marinobacterium sp. D7]|uniref:bifunctional 23S rRNA (guanine(2069)-N(7))-methyltransferase RlmK/23S rRNA (guanine(2445)-N(2))-methyltransferase RlmL n=1 Tax=Marinobacterium ramblicola TaxID=2849041 RepID=UPI001C2D8F8D|nr:bifunctional 23S rRNA (guanine(2069)-N(7))-methyltransferase RlmK/23S rRNA (guanine(2445)-N(2))-methyltransferase RlmL [Marinobacterium ramblicola]MBV1789559.1 bifunctional 23S rRNA (guanine(2069)-N(7))-methyltransferase RlmK/23S rRNA (guanine(2445)-N(2))-methyltransferase RlmL [Marinobacterium ramblicola]
MKFFVTCPKGIEQLLEQELQVLGADSTKQTVAGVYFEGDLALAYRVCLWSRLANRVLLQLAEGEAASADQLYQLVQSVDWLEHLRSSGTFCVDFSGKSEAINNTHFGALKVKDAVVDQIRNATGKRPTVERVQPDLRINAHLAKGRVSLAVDLSGESLHRRGYRRQAGAAPMKENLAAAVLVRAGWPELQGELTQVLDPMCGSGTLLIEAALMAADIAPGLFRRQFGFSFWLGHQASLWQALVDEAEQRRAQGLERCRVRFIGFDADAQVLARATQNARQAGVEHLLSLQQGELARLKRPDGADAGLVVTNPPYGERLGEESELMFLYQLFGQLLRKHFAGWRVAVFTGNPELCKVMKLRADKQYRMFNGSIPSQLLLFQVHEKEPHEGGAAEQPLSSQAQMFENRLRKNLKQLMRWRKRDGISCFRVYDADIPEYAVAVDYYDPMVMVQEYAPPASVDRVKAFDRVQEVVRVVQQVFELTPEQVVLKQRKRQQGSDQYTRHNETGHFYTVVEHGVRLRVNLHDYLDSGLFLDHRPVRRMIQQLAADKDVLNLFCYTASATCHAVVGGARSSTSVDMSATYLEWARRNLDLNGADPSKHLLVQEDCFKWLAKPHRQRYDLIFMDPPTFSNSKRMHDVLDVQRDHVRLISDAMQLLRPDGLLIFSNNYRRFSLDYEALSRFDIRDISAKTLDPDFKRNARIHTVFEVRHRTFD